ncbi:MAG TPA: tetratricopeptide repeat protein [Thermoanaerobaculia bacterium]|nr:tetratricopeptide repeat protein [Thermoanaerobaculia bacterium]
MSGSVPSGAGPPGASELVPVEEAARDVGAEATTLRRWLAPSGGVGYQAHELDWLRAAKRLAAEDLPAKRIRAALERLRERWSGRDDPPRVLVRVGNQIVVRDDGGEWSADSGQEWLPLEAAGPSADSGLPESGESPCATVSRAAVIIDLDEARRRRAGADGDRATAQEGPAELYRAAGEEQEAERSITLLRRVLALDAGHVEARLDLGALLHERGELAAAEREYREALRLAPENATAWFDLGVALEDRGDDREALDAYRRSLASDDGDADAWFNAARLLERLGDRAGAIAHLARYRQLQRESDR